MYATHLELYFGEKPIQFGLLLFDIPKNQFWRVPTHYLLDHIRKITLNK